MCDYSLHSIRNRLAVAGEQLVVHRFSTSSLGLASPADLRSECPAEGMTSISGLWSAFRVWLSDCLKEPAPAVCIPPGARLLLRDIPERLQKQYCVEAEEEVTFTQLTAAENCYRDAVRFQNGAEVLLQKLEPGQRVDVLGLSSLEPEPLALWPAAVSR